MARSNAARKQAPPDARFGSECASPAAVTPISAGDCPADMIGPTVHCDLSDLRPGETVLIRFGREHAPFLVAWVGPPGTPHAGHVGIKGMRSNQYTWDVAVRQSQNGKKGTELELELELVRGAARR